jgi:hypothetical protein
VLLHLAGARDDWQKAADWPLHRFKKLMAAGSFDLLTELWAWQERQQTGRAERTEAARARARSIPADRVSPAPLVTGQDLKSLGLSEGPALGRILRALYDRQLDEEFADRSEAMRAAEAMIGPAGEGDGA